MHMHLEVKKSGRFRKAFANVWQNKKLAIPVFTLMIAGLGFGIYSIVRAYSSGDQANVQKGSSLIRYGTNPLNSSTTWGTYRYNVTTSTGTHTGMCLQPNIEGPDDQDFNITTNTTSDAQLIKEIMLVSINGLDSTVKNAFDNANPGFWSNLAGDVTNLLRRDTNVGYSPCYLTDYYYNVCYSGCGGGACDSLASQVSASDYTYALGHMMIGSYINQISYGIDSSDVNDVENGARAIESWFNSSNNSAYKTKASEYELYETVVSDSSVQKIGWLEYKGPSTGQFRICKTSDDGISLAGAVFTIGSASYTTGSNGCTSYIEVEPQTITYYETTAPSGYVGYTSAQTCTVAAGDQKTCNAHTNSKIPTAYIKIKKVNTVNSGVSYAGLTVVGTVFSVKSGSTEVATITIGSDGTGITNVALPVGTYTISEKTATTGFNTNSATLTVVLNSSNTAANPPTVDMTTSSTACSSGSSPCWFKNEPIKGKFSLTKTGYEMSASGSAGSRNLSGITFTATNKADSSITYTIGPTDSNGSATSPEMIYGNYTVTEIRGDHNNAYNLLSFDVSITSSSTVAVSADKTNDTIPDTPGLVTVARNSNSTAENPDKELEIAPSVSVTDRITCSGLQSGAQYKLEGALYKVTGGTAVNSTGSSIFTATSSGTCGDLDMTFSAFDTSPYIDQTLGITQILYKNNGTSSSPDWVRIYIHNANLQDTNEQIKVKNIEIVTTANSERTINNKKLAAGLVKVLDTYEIIGLTNGQTFTLEGSVKDASGNTVATATDTITMTLTTGALYRGVMTFEFDSTPYVGQTLYVHQVLKSSSGTTLVTHTGTADNGETVTVLTPTLITDATATDGTKELYVGTVDVKDKVTYTGLASGSTYTIKGELWRLKADGTRDVKVADATDSFTASSEDDTTNGRTLTFANVDVITNCAVNNKLTLPCQFAVFEYIYYGSNNSPFQQHPNKSQETSAVTDTAQIVSVKDPTLESDAFESQEYTFGSADNSKVFALGSVSPIDEITYSNLVVGQTYNIKSELVYENGQPVKDKSGQDIIVRESFSATSTNRLVIDGFSKFDSVLDYDYSLGTNQKKYVVFQTLYYGDIELVAHKSLTDTRQTLQIGVPSLHTDARYKTKYGDTSSKFLGVGDVTMIDYVDYEGLVEDEWYTIEGYIFDPETGDIVRINDEYVENTKTFKAGAKGKGTVALEINLNTLTLQGRKLVVYERLYRSPREGQNDSRLLAVHEEALDEGDQTISVKIAKIETTASDKADGDNVLAHEDGQTIHDVIAYDGLLMGETYTLYGYLWDKTNNQILLDADGKRIDAYATFTTEIDRDNGTVEMDFPVDAYNLPGVEIVVFEYLFQGDQESIPEGDDGYPDLDQVIKAHADPNSVSQTVRVSMRVGTIAADVYDGDQEIGVGYVQVIDHLEYEGAKMGQKYKAKGWLVRKDTGEPIGVEGETIFTVGDEGYEETNGLVPIFFEFDSREFLGQSLVVYEELYTIDDDGTEELVAEHKDLDDEGQTITVATPTIHTTATDRADGDKELLYDADVIVLDRVEYTGLVKGTTYTLRGELVDKSTGHRVSGGVTEVTLTFTPTRDSGYEEMDFAINTTGLTGKELVVFETLYITPEETPIDPDEPDEGDDEGDDGGEEDEEEPVIDWGYQIAEHKDLNDEGQTIRVKLDRPNTGLFTRGIEGAVQTGLTIVAIGGLAVGAGIYFANRKHKKVHGSISFE